MLAYLRLIHNPDDRVSFERIINVPARGIGEKSLEPSSHWVARARADHRRRASTGCSTTIRFRLPSAARRTAFARFAQMLTGVARAGQAGDLLTLFDQITRDALLKSTWTKSASCRRGSSTARRQCQGAARRMLGRRSKMSSRCTNSSPSNRWSPMSTVWKTADNDRVTLMTLHSAKGLEFPVVFITGLDDRFPAALPKHGRDRRDRRRAPAILRRRDPRQSAFSTSVTPSAARFTAEPRRSASPSEFLADLPPAYCSTARRPRSPACAAPRAWKRRRNGTTVPRKAGSSATCKAGAVSSQIANCARSSFPSPGFA